MSSGSDQKLAVIEGALGLAEPVVQTACRLVENLLGPASREAGGLLQDQFRAWRVANRQRIAVKADARLTEMGLPPRVLPAGFLLPLLEQCGDAEEDELQDMWARLITGAIQSDDHVVRLHVETLRQMSRQDAIVFKEVVDRWLHDQPPHLWFDSPPIARLLVLGVLQPPTGALVAVPTATGRPNSLRVEGKPLEWEERDGVAGSLQPLLTPYGLQLAQALQLVPTTQ